MAVNRQTLRPERKLAGTALLGENSRRREKWGWVEPDDAGRFTRRGPARTGGAHLEAEWEVAARDMPIAGNFVEEGAWHPTLPAHEFEPFGNLWQWTRSSYSPYPGYEAAPGALGEYNGKFMCNQYVLRGGSCATPRSHIRATYRNFFPPDMRWQFCGLRLARDV